MTGPKRILCAHSDQNGEGAHWKNEGERCWTCGCRRCGQPLGAHYIVGKEDPTPDLPEGDFVPPWRGLYCPEVI